MSVEQMILRLKFVYLPDSGYPISPRFGPSRLTPHASRFLLVQPVELFEIDSESDRGHQVEDASRERPAIVCAEIIPQLPTRKK